MFEAMVAWIKHDKPARLEYMPKLMEHVRLPLLSRDYLVQVMHFSTTLSQMVHTLHHKVNLRSELSSDCGGRGFDQEQQHMQRLSHRSIKVSPAASGPAAPHQDRPDPTTNSNQHPQSTQKRTSAHWCRAAPCLFCYP